LTFKVRREVTLQVQAWVDTVEGYKEILGLQVAQLCIFSWADRVLVMELEATTEEALLLGSLGVLVEEELPI
jgi:hypothetical protein